MRYREFALASASLAALAMATPAEAKQEAREEIAIELAASGVVASGKSSDGLEDDDKSGGIFSAEAGYSYDKAADHFTIELSSAYYAYTDRGREDRWSNGVAASYGRDIAPDLQISALTSLSTRLSTLESSSADQAQLRGRLSYSPGPHRFRLTGGWRWRDYKDLPGSSGDGFVAAFDYRYRIARGHDLTFAARYDDIDSNTDRRDYRRFALSGYYGFKAGRNTSAEVGVEWRRWRYPSRIIGTESRRDWRITPRLSIRHDFGKGWIGEVEGTIIERHSNDNRFDETVKRATLTLRKRFRM